MLDELVPVILAGGAGTRLWPLSRELYPKQFLRLLGDKTMLQHTLARLDGLSAAPPIIVCNHEHRFVVAEQCRRVDVAPRAILLEPVARNTAPALALAALHATAEGRDPVLLAMPADSHFEAPEALRQAVAKGLPAARDGAIVVFGVTPTTPETGYGYIRAREPQPQPQAGDSAIESALEVVEFTEKPTRRAAAQYLDSGAYLWNSGMFLLRANVYLNELRAHQPRILAACQRAAITARRDLDFHRPGDVFADSPAESIDYAVMEQTDRARVVALSQQWADLGSWTAVADAQPQDGDGNSISGDVIAVSTTGSHLIANGRLLAAVGLRDAVVVETPDAVLVASKAHVQDVGAVVRRLREQGRTEQRAHTTSYRPWGQSETFKKGDGFLVKRITVAPGESLSLQLHHHRAEHWVVVRGVAEVRRGEETFQLVANQSTYIPPNERHRLANPGPTPLEVIEVQVGARLAEDDIVRFEDRYGRTVPDNAP